MADEPSPRADVMLGDLPPALRRVIEDRARTAGVPLADWVHAAIRAAADDEARMRDDMEAIELPPPPVPAAADAIAASQADAPEAFDAVALRQALIRLEQALDRRERLDAEARMSENSPSERGD